MVFYAFVLAMKPRSRQATSTALREIAVSVYNSGGLIRKLSNEGIMRPYTRFRDTNNEVLTYARYITLQVDMDEESCLALMQRLREHPDVLKRLRVDQLEKPIGHSSNPNFFPLDTFTRMEEEINWPPQVSADVYEQLDMNWKEFSRTRWSQFLRN
jgi:hypothetical protein